MTGSNEARLSLCRAGRARKRPDSRRQADQVEPLALEGFSSMVKPILRLAAWAALERNFDQARIATVHAAQQMDRIGEVARRVGAGRFEKGVEMRMTRSSLARDAS